MSEDPNQGESVGVSGEDSTLAPHHAEMLKASSITDEQAVLRGYETIADPARLTEINIAKAGRRTPGLLIPLRRKDNSVWGYHYRTDEPRQRNGKPVKYENPVGQRNGIDVPPGVGDSLGDPAVPLWITEGSKKADSGACHGLCIIALTGTWNWRGTNTSGGKTALPDFEDIALNGRRVILAYDGDVARKDSVRQALTRFAAYLKSKGAHVEYLHLPDTDTDKVGLDDHLAEHTVDELWSLVRPDVPPTREIACATDDQMRHVPQVTKKVATQDDADVEVIPDGRQFIDPREGLLSLTLARQVMKDIVCGWNPHEERFYTYQHGVWVRDRGQIEARMVYWLSDKHRNSHCRSVFDHIRARAQQVSREPQPDWINTANGMLDWRTGTLHPHEPRYGSTIQLPVIYDETADCPVFLDYLTDVLPADCLEATDDCPHGFIWELLGYTIYCGNPHHIAVLLYGKGRNGKSRLINVIKHLLGEHNYSTATIHELIENRFAAAALYGKQANLAGDLDSKWLDSTATFKKITGGDTMWAEHKYGQPFDFMPYALPIYSTNRAFGSADSSEGWTARWVIVPFPNSFQGREDRTLDERLTKPWELQGILRRAAQALPYLIARGRLTEPASVAAAKREFVTKSNALQAFLDDECKLEADAWTPRTEVYQRYRLWCDNNGHKILSSTNFYAGIGGVRGVSETIRKGNRGIRGLRLREPWESDCPDSEGAEGAEGAGPLSSDALHGKKDKEAAPSAPPATRRDFGQCKGGCGALRPLVDGLHCAGCLTTQNTLGAPEQDDDLRGCRTIPPRTR